MPENPANWTTDRIRRELLFTLHEQYMKDHRLPLEFSESILTEVDPPWRDLVRELAYLEEQWEVEFVSDMMPDRVLCRLTTAGRDAFDAGKYLNRTRHKCSQCLQNFTVIGDANGQVETIACPRCGAMMSVGGSVYSVQGEDADEVERVFSQIVAKQGLSTPPSQARPNPWISGSFYLAAVLVIAFVLLVIAKILPTWAVPPLIAGIVILVSVVGLFQLRQDDSLSEEGFVSLIVQFWKQLPSLLRKRRN